MLKIFLPFFLFFAFLRADNFAMALENLIFLNHQIAVMQKIKATEDVALLEEQKNYEFKKLTLELLKSRANTEVFDKILQEQKIILQNMQKDMKQNTANDKAKELAIQRLEHALSHLNEIMQNFAEGLEKIGIFSQENDVNILVNKTAADLAKQPHLKDLQDGYLHVQIQKYQEILQTYKEIIRYFVEHPRALLPQNALINLSVGWVLQKIAVFIPFDSFSLEFAKVLLSLMALIVLLTCRKFLARLIFFIINFFTHLSSKNHNLRNKICKDITTPITYALLLISFDIAVSILYYPNTSPQKIEVWFGLSYIGISVWFFIVLLQSYGVGIMGSILQKKDGFRREVINLILKVSYFFVVVIGILIALKYLGFNISAILASLGIGGLAVALALKDMLANFFASIMLLFENSFSQGDWIICENIEGSVVEMGLRRTSIRTFDNALVLVPNSTLANAAIVNWNRRKIGRRIKMSVGVSYKSSMEDIKKCIKEIREMLLSHPGIAKSIKADVNMEKYELSLKQNIVSMEDLLGYKDNLFVVLDTFEDSSISILVYCFSKSVAWGEFLNIKEDVMFKIMEIVRNNNLSFAFPSQSVYVESLPVTTKDL
ncbi:mechanosensitive ion channel family protein [Helicobacter sp. faydin-H20]|uniref:mechanosensitive ion channel family protein n=1 Tax=Helicobacter anatolicus TaxID=2905874 RepID=UPI001E5C36CD|nr:mechanosensitive ion channel family protein [Helicobacter anatolicus]MCE3037209.1 mechanosensitive ion channel family protein [Helicobacter anatolicus]